MTRRGILTVTLAVVGLALSAALGWSASQLAGQRIGLASEPLSVVRGLAPQHPAVRPAGPSHDNRGKRHPRPAAAPKPASTPTSTGSQIFTTPAPTATVTSAAPAPSAPAPPTSPPASTPASGGLSSSGAGGHHDDHHADD